MIYFDNAATTRPCPEAVAAASDAMTVHWANPSSVHGMGNAANAVLADSRKAVAKALGLRRETEGRVFFTGSGTEGDNLAVFGSVYAKKRPLRGDYRGRILTTDSEHPAVEEAMLRLEADGFEVCRIPTLGGALDFDYIESHSEGVILASLMLVNNETGALYDVRRAFDAIRRGSPDAVTHTDAVQGFMKVRFTPAALGADMVTVSAHKIGGVKGVGALYVSEPILKAKKLIPVIAGGGQEYGMRSGTENLPGIAAFAAACRVSADRFSDHAAKMADLRARILSGLSASDEIRVNTPVAGIDGILSVTMPGVRSETVLNDLSARGICVSAGSACSAHGVKKGNRVLQAFGLSRAEADTTVRVSLGPDNTEEEADALVRALLEVASTRQRVR